MSTRTFTLANGDDVPTIDLPVVDHLSGGCPVMLATMSDLQGHIADLRRTDPNGTWGSLHVYMDTDDRQQPRLRLHDCETASCDRVEHDYADDVTIGWETASAGMFRVVWIDLMEVTA